MTTVTVPAGVPNRLSGRDGQIYSTRTTEGRIVVDLMPHDLDALLNGPEGESWAKVNPGLSLTPLAPAGTCSYSYGGKEFKVPDDRLIVVTDEVASALRSHGFITAPGS
jgi:hypothetical protein